MPRPAWGGEANNGSPLPSVPQNLPFRSSASSSVAAKDTFVPGRTGNDFVMAMENGTPVESVKEVLRNTVRYNKTHITGYVQ